MKLLSRIVALSAALLLPSTLAAQFTLESRFTSRLAPGPHAVGFRVVEQFDGSRVAADAAEYASNPDRYVRGRPIQTLIWYPAKPARGAAEMRFREYASLFTPDGTFPVHNDSGRQAAIVGLQQYLQRASSVDRELDSPVRTFRDAAPEQGRFPVIVYAPGSNSPAFQNGELGEYLASQGYIVVASPSWGK